MKLSLLYYYCNKMHFVVLILFCVVIVMGEEDMQSPCVKGNPCQCDVNPFQNPEFKISCEGEGSFEAAAKVMEQYTINIREINLRISSSSIQNLTGNHLNRFSNLKMVSLPGNNINIIEPLAFQNTHEIVLLDLSNNHLIEIDYNTFGTLKKLQNLTLAHNDIKVVNSNAFHQLIELQHLDLSNNKLHYIDPKWFKTCKNLLFLSLANNNIESIESNAFQYLVTLKILDLSGNKLSSLSYHIFIHLNNLRNVSLAWNHLKTLKQNVFQGNKMLENVNLTGNHWVCDKDLLPLLDWLKAHEIDKAYCTQPPEFKNSSLQIGLFVLYLEIKLSESAICNASMCNCSVSKEQQVVMVDCVGKGFTKLPDTLPFKTRVLDLGGNNIQSLTTDHVNSTQWAYVSFLRLDNNLIDSLKGLEGTWLLRNLVALNLSKNRLTEIPIHILEQFRGGLLDELYLSGNPWNCDCNTVRFQTWLQDNYKSIKDFDGIRCSPESGSYSNQPIYRLLKSQLCPQQKPLINYLDVLNSLMAVAIILIIMKLSFDYWLQKRTGKLPRFFSLNVY